MTHTKEQPGLHAHSWNPATDLMKQFVVERRLGTVEEPKGWLALASFSDLQDASDDEWDREELSVEEGTFQFHQYRIRDQFNNTIV